MGRRDQQSGQYDIALEALILTAQMREQGQAPHRMSHSNTTDLYWTVAQLVAHHTCNGCNLLPGDIFGSGTISGPTAEGYGSLSELSHGRHAHDHACTTARPAPFSKTATR